jgi:hypothetical protein
MTSKSSPALPFGALGDTFELMQKMWGMGSAAPGNLAALAGRMPQQMPSMIAPTVDVEELDKRIADLRAVEQWLELNAGMLRTTIQTLEVQRATIATLKGIGGAMLAPMLGSAEPQKSVYPPLPPEFAASVPAPADEPAHEPKPARKRRKPSAGKPALADDALNPAAWWHALQDQFSKIAAAAGEAPAEPQKSKKPTKRSRRAKARPD